MYLCIDLVHAHHNVRGSVAWFCMQHKPVVRTRTEDVVMACGANRPVLLNARQRSEQMVG